MAARFPGYVPAGVIPAALMPFNEDLSIDETSLRRHMRDLAAVRGISALCVNGVSQEVPGLTLDEQRRALDLMADEVGDRIPLMHGVYAHGPLDAAQIARQAEAGGASCLLVFPPAVFARGAAMLPQMTLGHYKAIADATDLPLGIYNNPPRVKSDLHWDQLLRIFKHPNYVVHKESTTRVGQVAQVLYGAPDVSVMCCDSPNLGLVVPTMSLGGHGTANMTGNIAPAELTEISQPWTSPEVSFSFRESYLRNLQLLHYSYSAINPVAIKSLMKAVGLPAGELRKPLRALEGEPLLKGLRAVKALGLDKKYGWNSLQLKAA